MAMVCELKIFQPNLVLSNLYRNQHLGLVIVFDLLFTDSPGVVAASVGIPLGTSDHSVVFVTIKIEQAVPDVSFSHKIFIKS